MTTTLVARSVPSDDNTCVDQHHVWRMEARARRAARRVGLVARKSRWRVGTADNYGGFAIFDPLTNFIVYGWQYDLEPEDVIELASADTESEGVYRKQEVV